MKGDKLISWAEKGSREGPTGEECEGEGGTV